MRTQARFTATAIGLAAAALIAACGSAAPAASGPAGAAAPARTSFLATSLDTAGGTWAVAVMGGSAATHNNFWQLFIRPAGSSSWKLATPPGTADNGGLVLAAGGPSLITAFRPSQSLTYTPLTATSDSGQAWASTGPLDGALAATPDALAAAPGAGGLLALLTDGTAELAVPGYTSWKTLATQRSVAATPARRCGLQALTAVAYTPAGEPLLAGACSHSGTAGIFADAGATWSTAGPTMPAALSSERVTVMRLITSGNQIVALLATGTGHAASLLAAWSADNGQRWTLSPALRLGGAALASASFGAAATAAVITTSGHADVITSGGASQWHALPALPPGTATLATGPGEQTEALAVHGGTLTVWQLQPGGTSWTRAQTINVPIQYGTSG